MNEEHRFEWWICYATSSKTVGSKEELRSRAVGSGCGVLVPAAFCAARCGDRRSRPRGRRERERIS